MGEKNQGKKGGLRKWFGFKDDHEVVNSGFNTQDFTAQSDFNLCERFLSDAEIKFYKVLKNMASERLEIFPKVSPIDVFSIQGSLSDDFHQKLSRKHVDFLLCDSETFKPVLAVELEDSSLSSDDSVEKDEQLSSVFAGSDLPLVQIQAQESYQISELAKNFREAIENVSDTIEEEIDSQVSG
jgi:hypothetical protein